MRALVAVFMISALFLSACDKKEAETADESESLQQRQTATAVTVASEGATDTDVAASEEEALQSEPLNTAGQESAPAAQPLTSNE